jgi:mannose-6-phosphate isomerase-like protein (cupin superfamily)
MAIARGDLDRILVAPDAGEWITRRESRDVSLIAALEEITITRYRLGTGERGPDPHVHRKHTDAFYVLDGELGFVLGPDREPVRVGAGGLVAAPPNVIHTFVNDSEGEVRFLNVHTPDGGFAAYMRASRDGDKSASFDSFAPPPDGGRPLSDAIVSATGEGERLVSGNRTALLKAVLEGMCFAEFELDGRFAGPGLHHHEAEVDAFYVLEGELEITVEEITTVAGPGTLAAVPAGIRHTFAHAGEGRARFLNLHAPDGGFAEFLRRVSD